MKSYIPNIFGMRMSSFLFKSRDGGTPLDPDQTNGLIPNHITTMAELDVVEDLNIGRGLEWLNRQKSSDYLSTEFLDTLHRKLFGDVWKWAGTHRKGMVNLSKVDRFQIRIELKNLFDDVKVWIDSQSIEWDQIVAEFHHRLVCIHPYPNGNGRISRIMTECLQKRNGKIPSTWMNSLNSTPTERRDLYISALRSADGGDYSSLVDFIKSD